MIHDNEEDEFTKMLRAAVDPEHRKLGSVPVDLRVEEIELIKWALEDYARMKLVYALNVEAEKIASDSERAYSDVISRVQEAFNQVKGMEIAFERLRTKLDEAVAEAHRRNGNEPPLPFSAN